MFIYLNYYLYKNLIDKVEHDNKIKIDREKLFLYSNVLNIPYFFRFKGTKLLPYDVARKIEYKKGDLLLYNMIETTRASGFNPSDMGLLYGCAISILLKQKLCRLNLSDRDAHIVDELLRDELDKDLDISNLYYQYPSSFILNFTELDFMSKSLQNTYYLSNIDRYLILSTVKFKECFKKSIISRMLWNFEDLFFKKKREISRRDVAFKGHIHLSKKKAIYYQEKLNEVKNIINDLDSSINILFNALKNAINFNKKQDFLALMEEIGFNDYEKLQSYLKEQKKTTKSRKKLIKITRKKERKAR